MTIETEDMPPMLRPEEVLKLADSYASTNFFDGCAGNPIHGPQSQAQRAILNEALLRVYQEIDLLNMALRSEAQFSDEQKAIAEEQGNKVIEIKNSMNIVVEECRGLKEMNDLMAMNAELLITLIRDICDKVKHCCNCLHYSDDEELLRRIEDVLGPGWDQEKSR